MNELWRKWNFRWMLDSDADHVGDLYSGAAQRHNSTKAAPEGEFLEEIMQL
jgi:hypothetical protein